MTVESTIWWEMLVKHHPIPVGFLVGRHVVAPFRLGVGHHFICDVDFGVILKSIDPAISNTIAKLFLLTPQDIVRKVWLDVWFVGSIERPFGGYIFQFGR